MKDMRTSLFMWLGFLNDLRRRGIKIVHRSAFEAFYRGKEASLAVILNRLEKKGLITRVTRNWYIIAPCEVWEIVKAIFPSAYLSLEWALHYYDILDQEIRVITLVWLGKTKIIHSNKYIFELHRISPKLYFGFDERMIAEPEKALLDTIYIRGKVPPELNVELLDLDKLNNYARLFPKRVKEYVKELMQK